MKHVHMMRRVAIAAAGACCVLALSACGGAPADTASAGSLGAASDPVELQIFAANSLEKALPEVQELYTEKTGVTFADTQFKASGDLVEQLRAGAPADILVTASSSTMDTALDANLVDRETRRDLFTNELVVARAEGSDAVVSSLEDLRDVPGKVAIGDAKTVPAGRYANQALSTVGLYSNASGIDGDYAPGFAERVALADKVGTAAAYVSTGDAALGFVYSSDIYRYEGIEEAYVTPSDSHDPIVYPGAVTKGSSDAREAEEFLDFCQNDKDAQRIWARYGFELAAS